MTQTSNKTESLTDILKELNSLTGLKEVKEEVEKLQSSILIEKQRKAKGLPVSPFTYHCVFTGNPGTGKTTVARIIGKIYKSLGILKKGELIEVTRNDLVGQYVGHTAHQVDKVIATALDNVLFIDEAYSLATGGQTDYGKEAIDTLVKRMEDYRDRLVVIVAGYPAEMKKFIETNPGMKSRFNNNIHFRDYSSTELYQIFKGMCVKSRYFVNPTEEIVIVKYFNKISSNNDKSFGNGRGVRNFFEKLEKNQRHRLALNRRNTKVQLSEFTHADVFKTINEILPNTEKYDMTGVANPDNAISDKLPNTVEQVNEKADTSAQIKKSNNKAINGNNSWFYENYIELVKQLEVEKYIEKSKKYNEEGDYEKAVSLFDKAKQLKPDIDSNLLVEIYLTKLNAIITKDKTIDVTELIDKLESLIAAIIKLNPKETFAELLGRINNDIEHCIEKSEFSKAHKLNEFVKLFNSITNIDNSLKIFRAQADFEFSAKNYYEAMKLFKEIKEINPKETFSVYIEQLSHTIDGAISKNKFTDADLMIKALSILEPDLHDKYDLKLILAQFDHYIDSSDFKTALSQVKKLKSHSSKLNLDDFSQKYFEIAQKEFENKNYPKAISILEICIKISAKARSNDLLAECYLKSAEKLILSQNFEEVIINIEKAIHENSKINRTKLFDYYQIVIDNLAAKGQFDEAFKILNILDIFDKKKSMTYKIEFYRSIAGFKMNNGDSVAAFQYFKMAKDLEQEQ